VSRLSWPGLSLGRWERKGWSSSRCRFGGGRDLTCGRRAREAEAVPCDDGVHTSAEPIQWPDAPEGPEDPPHASECPSGLGERAVSAVGALVRVDPPHSLGDRLAREPHRRRIIDELPRHHADTGWKASPGEVRGPRADPAIPVEDQDGLSVTRVRRRLLHNPKWYLSDLADRLDRFPYHHMRSGLCCRSMNSPTGRR
jgi:hypothetical protein